MQCNTKNRILTKSTGYVIHKHILYINCEKYNNKQNTFMFLDSIFERKQGFFWGLVIFYFLIWVLVPQMRSVCEHVLILCIQLSACLWGRVTKIVSQWGIQGEGWGWSKFDHILIIVEMYGGYRRFHSTVLPTVISLKFSLIKI